MINKPPISKPPIDSQWPLPLNAKLRGGLRNMVRQYSDGSSNILVPKGEQVATKRSIITPPGAVGNIPPCSPASVSGISADPVSNPYNVDDVITFSPVGLTGSGPISYFWFVDGGAPRATTPTFTYTVQDSDIDGKDPSGLGHFFVLLAVENACGTDSASENYPAQGTP